MNQILRRALLFLLAVSVAATIAADGHHTDPYLEETGLIINEYRDTRIGEMTFGEVEEMMARLSVPYQKSAHVRSSAMKSFLLPGLGQFANDAAGSGTLFLLGGMVIKAGTAVGSYLLLPDAVTFSTLDYLNASNAEIETAWKSLSLTDLAPAFGVMAGGMLIDHLYRMLSAKHAGRLARDRIASGAITFEPRISFLPGGAAEIALHASY